MAKPTKFASHRYDSGRFSRASKYTHEQHREAAKFHEERAGYHRDRAHEFLGKFGTS